MFNYRIINAPVKETIAMLSRRMNPELRKQIANQRFDCVGLVQADLPDLFYFADIGQKAGSIIAIELYGGCPQNISTIALFGDVGSINAAIEAIKFNKNTNKK